MPKRKKHIIDGDAAERMSGGQKFKVSTFCVIIDQLQIALKKCPEAYFMVLIDGGILRIVGKYLKDLSFDFQAEFHQFRCWYQEQRPVETTSTGSAQVMFQLLHTTRVHHGFPNTEVAFQIYG